MDVERFKVVEALFDRAVAVPPAQRPALLDAACDDQAVRAEVEAMLAADEAAGGSFIEDAVGGGATLVQSPLQAFEVGAFIGKYELLGRIGEGGFGQVYRGRDTVLGRPVAIKSCTSNNERLRQRFVREAQISARLQHPNVVTVHDLGVQDQVPYLVQELLGGEDLDRVIARRDDLDTAKRLDLLRQMARGLAYAHGQGVLHRDVKPANMRVLPNGRVKILDFGIARLLDHASGLTTEGTAMGTVGYMAPEQLRGDDQDRRADLFSFGVVAYELLSYTRPFDGKTFSEVSYNLLYEAPPRLVERWPTCPPALDTVVMRCLHRKPDDRYPGFPALIADLDAVIDDPNIELRSNTELMPTVALPVPKRRRSWSGLAIAVPVAAGVLLTVLAFALLRPWFENRDRDLPKQAGDPVVTARPPEEHPAVAMTPAPPPDGTRAEVEETPETKAPPTSPASETRTSTPTRDEATREAEPREADATTTPPTTEAPDSQTDAFAGLSARMRGEEDEGRTLEEEPVSADLERRADAPTEPGTDRSRDEPVTSRPPVEGSGLSAESVRASDAADRRETTSDSDTPVPATLGVDDPPPTEEPTLRAPVEGAPSPALEPGDTAPPATTITPTTIDLTDFGNAEDEAHEILQPGPDVAPPRLLDRSEPDYPPIALRRKISARVVLGVLVDETGRVIQVFVKQDTQPKLGFAETAKAAAFASRFDAATSSGIPGRMWFELAYNFEP